MNPWSHLSVGSWQLNQQRFPLSLHLTLHPSRSTVQAGKLIILPWEGRDDNVALTQERTVFRRPPFKVDILHKQIPFGLALAAYHCWT